MVYCGQRLVIFITSTPNQRVMLRPLIAAWISIAIKALMNRNINNTHSNMWFVIDELPALHKISSLPIALAESRKYGGCRCCMQACRIFIN